MKKNEEKEVFSIAENFSKFPGPRYVKEGKYSGEELRKQTLRNIVKEAIKNKRSLLIDLDGTKGYGTSFLEEVFGGLIREDGISLKDFNDIITFKSDEESFLIDDIKQYMFEASNEKNK